MNSALALQQEIQSAFLRGWYLRHAGHPRPQGQAAITKLEQAGWEAWEEGGDAVAALGRYERERA